ncbi:MAG: BON domain-containing protein, partial [Limisphaerales bacterium]
MKKPGSPLGVAGGEPNFHYQDNRAHGVGSATSGEFATAPVNQNIEIGGQSDLAQKVKGRLTRESTGTHGLMRHGVARNIQVSAQGNDVTLTGTVPSQKDKEMIEIRTREIAGVHRVNNQLIVTPEAEAAHRNVTRGSDLEDVTSEIQD